MNVRHIALACFCSTALALFAPPTEAATGKSRTLEEEQASGLIQTGLNPVYPTDHACLEVSSPFGSRTRYDGSRRVEFSNHGYHGGMDISIKIGQPIVAVADGEVIHVATGGRLVGNMIMLRHAPEDTGFDRWVFSKYQHFDRPSDLTVGARIMKGQVIGIGGRSGTTGGHYGSEGYPHLHMNIYYNETGKYKPREGTKVAIDDAHYGDPLALFFGKSLDSHVIRALPQEQKTFPISYTTTDGKVFPESARIVWPIPCTP